MTLDRPPRMTKTVTPAGRDSQRFGFDADQLLILAIVVLLWQNDAPMMLILALLYIAL